MGYIDQVKQWFVSKAKPTQTQYHTLFDYLRFKDQIIPVGDVQNLTALLLSKLDVSVYNESFLALTVQEVPFNGNGNVVVPAGYLFEKCIVLPSSGANIKVGMTSGGEEIFPENVISVAGEVIVIEKYSSTAPVTFYFTGIPVSSTVITFIRKIKNIG